LVAQENKKNHPNDCEQQNSTPVPFVVPQTSCDPNEPWVSGKVVCDWAELLVTVCDAITGFNCDWCSSRLLSSITANQNDQNHPVAAKRL